MNAISSSVNKGAFKAAPKAGAVRRPRKTPGETESISAARPPTGNERQAAQNAIQQEHQNGLLRADTNAATESQNTEDSSIAEDRSRSTRARDKKLEKRTGQEIPIPSTSTARLSKDPIPFHERELEPEFHAGQDSDGNVVQARRTAQIEVNHELGTTRSDRKPQELKEEDSSTRSRKRPTSTKRRAREPTPDAAEHEVIDRTQATMGALITDQHKGRKSAKFEAFKILQAEKRRRQRLAKLAAKQPGLKLTEEDTPGPVVQGSISGEAVMDMPVPAEVAEVVEDTELQEEDDGDHDLFLPDTGAPRTRVVNGEIVIDPRSLQVDRAIRDAVDDEDIEYVEENPLERMVNSRTYSKRINSSRWDAESTHLFYTALSQWGTDFDMISRMFPGRNRKQIKSKFTIEERRNPTLVNSALINKAPVDMVEYSRISEVEYRSVDQMESELADLKTQFEAEREEAIKEAQQQKAEQPDDIGPQGPADPPKKKARKRDINDGVEIMGDNEELEAEERRAAAERAALDSDYESA